MKNKVLFFEYVSDFLEIYLKKQCGKSIHTVESYRDSLTVFRKFLLDAKHITIKKFLMLDCNKEIILEFVEYLRANNRKITTINHHISAIKSYLWYVSDIDITYQGIASSVSHIPTFRVPVEEKEYLNDDELIKLFNTPPNTAKGNRNRTIMILMYETAMRLSEVVYLKRKDVFIDTSDPYILVHGKGDKERIVALSSNAVKHLKQYLRLYHNDKCDYLFYTVINGKADHLSPSTIETFIQKYADEIRKDCPDLPAKVHPHMFRRTRATHLYQDGIPLELVSRILGHSSMETTKIYAKPSLDMLRNAIENENDVDILPAWNNEDEVAKLFGIR